MADINITDEADALMEMEKRCADERMVFPLPAEVAIPLTSVDKRENFMLDVTRAQIKLTKATYQNRARAAIVLLRLDLDGPPHRNPDGEEIPCPHLHIYREGYGDKWASAPLPVSNTLDLFLALETFMQECNITGPPAFRKGYFHDADVAEIEKLLNDYRAWLKDRTTLREINGTWVEITTPYLDRHNDALQI